MSNRTYQCERCFQIFDRYYQPEVVYDEASFCPNCFISELIDARCDFKIEGMMLTVEAVSMLEEPEELTDEEYMDVITVI